MATKIVYRCKNTGGPDGDCEHAASNETLEASAVTFNESGQAICPGETVFGEPCGAILEEVIPPKKLPLGIIAGSVAGLIVVACVVWFFFLGGDAQLRIEQTSITLAPGQSVKVEIFNDGNASLKLDDVTFSDNEFSVDKTEDSLEIAPGKSGFLRIKFAQKAQNNIQGKMTIDSNSSNGPVSIELEGNANPWTVAEKLNSTSTILDKE
ncbi:DUF1573 domain-containing protein [Photobacterium piscicola]|uniref:DUF1573 domain-containing protein n=1 Tax=Photobacterium piscicola TaxID=1378299 RepID=A0ABU6LCX7_9GAMM|nr:DUF1573 domain-containing protein [Photobacterium piscicola]MEC6897205.1 DUF1573 domain-containing protein [Photobacterium piscicola]